MIRWGRTPRGFGREDRSAELEQRAVGRLVRVHKDGSEGNDRAQLQRERDIGAGGRGLVEFDRDCVLALNQQRSIQVLSILETFNHHRRETSCVMVGTKRIPSHRIRSWHLHLAAKRLSAVDVNDNAVVMHPLGFENRIRRTIERKILPEVERDTIGGARNRSVQWSKEAVDAAAERTPQTVVQTAAVVTKQGWTGFPTRSAVGVVSRKLPARAVEIRCWRCGVVVCPRICPADKRCDLR